MHLIKKINSKNASILVFALWSLALLSFLALHIGLRIRQRIHLLERLEHRSQLHWIAQSGVYKAIAILNQPAPNGEAPPSTFLKAYRHNNSPLFENVRVGRGTFNVGYDYFENGVAKKEKRFGVVDEESKINLNSVDVKILRTLIANISTFDQQQADTLANAIIDWREFGESQMTGFYSEDYYDNLTHPYKAKKAAFEWIDELLLVKGINEDILEKLLPYVTIYGDGLININTVSAPVLLALGLDSEVADKILLVRRGLDNVEATGDDVVFKKTFDLVSDIRKIAELNNAQAQQVDALNTTGKIKTDSEFFYIRAEGRMGDGELARIDCIYDVVGKIIKYWREK